ncbi:TolC family protein [Salinispira pacifica]
MKNAAAAIGAVLFLLGLAPLFSQSRSGSNLTVEDAVTKAVENQPLVLKAEAAVAAARAGIGEAQSSYFPTISGSASYTRLGPDQSVDLGPLGSFSLYPVDNYGFQVGLNQLIFASGSRGLQVRLARAGVDAARIGVEQVKMNIAYQTVQTFYSVLFLEQEMKVLDEQLYDLNQHLDVIQKKADTGSATKYDVLSTEVRVASLQSQKTAAESQYQKAEIALRQLVGLAPDAKLSLAGDFSPGSVPTDRGALVNEALSNRVEVRQAAQAQTSAELAQSLAWRGGLPTLSAHASFGFKNGLLPDSNSLTANWSAGVQLNVPIFSGLLNARKIDEAQAKLQAAVQGVAAAKQSVTTDVREAVEDIDASRKQAEASLVQLNHAQEMVNVAKVRYDVGVITNVEYLDAQTSLAQAKLAHLRDVYHQMMSQYTLKQALGQKIWQSPAGLPASPAGSPAP